MAAFFANTDPAALFADASLDQVNVLEGIFALAAVPATHQFKDVEAKVIRTGAASVLRPDRADRNNLAELARTRDVYEFVNKARAFLAERRQALWAAQREAA